MGRKKPCAANEGTCDLLNRLAALSGLLVTWLEAATELLAGGGGPRREPDGCDGGCDDSLVNDCDRSPSSELISVTRDDIPPTEGVVGFLTHVVTEGNRWRRPVRGYQMDLPPCSLEYGDMLSRSQSQKHKVSWFFSLLAGKEGE